MLFRAPLLSLPPPTTSKRSARPTRSALLTGRLPIRTGNCSVPLPGQGDYGLAPWEYTIGELFSDAGYATASLRQVARRRCRGTAAHGPGLRRVDGHQEHVRRVGILHLRAVRRVGPRGPADLGGRGRIAGHPGRGVQHASPAPLLDGKIADRAVDVHHPDRRLRDAVLHLHLLHPAAPAAGLPSGLHRRGSGGGAYSDAMAELDHRTGQVLDAIDQAGITDNTIVVWNSDNPAGRAPSMGGSNGPWRGHFGSGFEGGMRAPAMIRWPAKIEAGAATDEILSRRRLVPDAGLVRRRERPGSRRPPHRRHRRVVLLPRATATPPGVITSSTSAPTVRRCR